MDVTFVIPVFNGEKYIAECIECIENMHYDDGNKEIIVVDNGSTDSTLNILVKKNIDYIVCKEGTISKLRNLGAMKSKSDFIAFVDSDCFISNDWFPQAKKVFSLNDDIAVVGRYYSSSENPTWVEKLWVEMKKDIEGSVDFLPGGNMVFRKEIFNEINGFDENLVTGEDHDICSRVKKNGHIVYNSKNVSTIHMGNFKKLGDIIKKERWYGKGMFKKDNFTSRPLLISLVFILLFAGGIILSFFNILFLFLFVFLIFLLVLFVSTKFSKNVSSNKLIFIIKFFPISFAYIIGRSLSVYDRLFYLLGKR